MSQTGNPSVEQTLQRLLLLVVIAQASSVAIADSYLVHERWSSNEYYALQRVEEGGKGLGEIFADLPPANIVGIVITNPISKVTGDDIRAQIEILHPEQYTRARDSAGNLHNPELRIIREQFIETYKRTDAFEEIELVLKKFGFRIVALNYEKLTMNEGVPRVNDLHIEAIKAHQ